VIQDPKILVEQYGDIKKKAHQAKRGPQYCTKKAHQAKRDPQIPLTVVKTCPLIITNMLSVTNSNIWMISVSEKKLVESG
jgi:hypothetical protein